VGLAAAESGVPLGAPPPVEVYLKYLYYSLLPKVQTAANYGGIMDSWSGIGSPTTGPVTATPSRDGRLAALLAASTNFI